MSSGPHAPDMIFPRHYREHQVALGEAQVEGKDKKAATVHSHP